MFLLCYFAFALMFLLVQITDLAPKARTSFVLTPVALNSIYMAFFLIIMQGQSVRVTRDVVSEAYILQRLNSTQ